MNPNKKRTLTWSKKKLLLFSVITVLILFLILELIFRIVFYFQYKGLHNTVAIQGSTLRISDPLLIYKNQPFYVDYNKEYQNNEKGMRSAVGDEFIGQKKDGDFWVLLTGGSAIEGMGSNKDGQWLDITGVRDHPYHQTIGYYLQAFLQQKMPNKKIKVFNAASSGYTIYQSYWRYMSLSQRINPDWVISMDGVNEPPSLSAHETIRDYLQEEWKAYPQFHYPLKLIIPMTKNSALINMIKQKLFHIKEDYRLQKNKKENFPEREKWVKEKMLPIEYSSFSVNIQMAIDSFTKWVSQYDSTLTSKGVNHLLLIQPYLSMRDTSKLNEAEQAVNNYFRANFQDPLRQKFLDSVYHYFSADTLHPNIAVMNAVHQWQEWVFVDYCHFTDAATKKIAEEICNYIISDHTSKPFK